MLDLTTIPEDTIIARGQYATVRSAHEDAKKQLSILCGQFANIAPMVLRAMQPAEDDAPDMRTVNELLATGKTALAKMEKCADEIEQLSMQRAALKGAAWGKRP